MFYQLNPTIPLKSPKASGECIAVIDYSSEHNLLFVIIDDETGEVWTVPNADVRGFKNYSVGRNLEVNKLTEKQLENLEINQFKPEWRQP